MVHNEERFYEDRRVEWVVRSVNSSQQCLVRIPSQVPEMIVGQVFIEYVVP